MNTRRARESTLREAVTKQDTLINAGDYVLVDGYPKTATVAASALIPAKFGVTLPDGLVRITLVPRGDVYIEKTTATAESPLVPSGGYNYPVRKAEADLLALYADSVKCDLWAYQKRA